MNTPNYDNIKKALSSASNLVTPSELHGILCGLVCAGLQKLDMNSIDSLILHLPDEETDNSINSTLNDLFIVTSHKIRHFELDFGLLLPDEDESLAERARELGKWCDGFLAGIGLAGKPFNYRDEEEVTDILHKLSEAAKIQFHNVVFEEDDETAFLDVTEYVRLSVFAIYQELSDSDTGSSEETYH